MQNTIVNANNHDHPLLAALRQSRSYYLIRIDLEGRYTYANDFFLQKFGFLFEQLLGRPYAETIHPDDFEICQAAAAYCIRHPGEVKQLIIRKPHPDGSFFYTNWEFVAVTDAVGTVIEIQAIGYDMTIERNMAARLSEAHLILGQITTNAPFFVYIFDLQADTIDYYNQSVLDTWGIADDVVLLMGAEQFLQDWVHPDDVATLQDRQQTFLELADNQVERIEHRLRTPSLGYIWVENTIKVLARDEAGQVTKILGFLQDISERKRAELQAEEITYRLWVATRTANIGIWDYNPQTAKLVWDDNMFEVYGVDPADFDGTYQSWRRRVYPDDLAAAEAELTRAMTGGRTFDTEFRIIRADGTIRHIKANAEVTFNQAGQVERVIGTNWDITEQRTAEQEIQNLSKFPQGNPNPVLRISRDGDILFSNEAAQVLLDAWCDEQDHRVPQAFLAQIQAALSSGTVVSFDYPVGEQSFLLAVTPFVQDGFVYVYAFDITDRRQLEAHLQQTQKIEAVGQLASGVAHNFNNMLTAFMGYASLAMESIPESHSAYADLQGIQETVERAANITKQLLAFTRQQANVPSIFNLNDLTLSTRTMLRQLISEDIEMHIQPGTDLWSVKADPGQIEQVLINLIVNARDAMLDGGKVTIETGNVTLNDEMRHIFPEMEPGDYVMLQVSDTGTGMSEAVQSRIFEPFFTTKAAGQGTGLGLPTCLGIVQQNGGYITVDSELGRGTVFHIFLPRAIEDAPVDTDVARTLPGGSEAVLVVEDEAVVRDLVARSLREHGYHVLTAINGQDALQVWRENAARRIDLVITDVVMPYLGGIGLVRMLRTQNPMLRILYISGYTENNNLEHHLDENRVSFLQKPFPPGELLRTVRQILDAPF